MYIAPGVDRRRRGFERAQASRETVESCAEESGLADPVLADEQNGPRRLRGDRLGDRVDDLPRRAVISAGGSSYGLVHAVANWAAGPERCSRRQSPFLERLAHGGRALVVDRA